MFLKLNKENFAETLKNNDIVLIEFYAEWCAPCKMINPILEDLALEFKAQIKIAQVNVEQSVDLAFLFDVVNLPTLIFFKNEKEVNRIIGNQSFIMLRIKKHLLNLL